MIKCSNGGDFKIMFKKIIKQICEEENIKYKTISKDWVIVLEKNGVINLITGYKFGDNNHALGELLDDKYATYELLNEMKLPTINYNIVYSKNNKNDYAAGCNSVDYVKELFHKYNENVVLKVNDGTCGLNVKHIIDEGELVQQYEALTSNFFSISVCPFYEIENEYRAIVVNGKAELVYKKIRPIVVGDGKSTIKELLKQFNSTYFSEKDDERFKEVLQEGEVFEYDWRFNLARGAKASLDFPSEIKMRVEELAEKISKKIGLGFGSIDIIKTANNQFLVMEINSGVMMENFIKQIPEGYEIAKNIYKKAIENLKW